MRLVTRLPICHAEEASAAASVPLVDDSVSVVLAGCVTASFEKHFPRHEEGVPVRCMPYTRAMVSSGPPPMMHPVRHPYGAEYPISQAQQMNFL
jgi:hypothetical protein